MNRHLPGVSLGYFVVLLDTTVLAVAEPDLAASLHTPVAGLQWVVAAYTVVFGALLLSAGAVADRFGADRVFRAGTAGFGVLSLLCAAAPSAGALTLLRGLLGVAAAAVVPASTVLVGRLHPEPAARARAVAVWAAVSGAALATGPVAGGLLIDAGGWRLVFLINVPLAGLVLALTAGAGRHGPRGTARIDVAGQALAALTLGLLTDALIAAGAHAWPHAVPAAAGAVAAGAGFAAWERRSTAPAVVRVPGVAPALVAGAAVGFVLSGVLFVLPLVLQGGRGLTAAGAGLAMLPMTVPFAVNPLLTGRIVARWGPWPPVLAGLGLVAAAAAGLAAAVATRAAYPWLGLGLAGLGLGVSLTLPALVTALLAAAPAPVAGRAGGLFNAVRQAGATLGVAVTGAFATGRAPVALLLCAVAGAAALPWAARRTAAAVTVR